MSSPERCESKLCHTFHQIITGFQVGYIQNDMAQSWYNPVCLNERLYNLFMLYHAQIHRQTTSVWMNFIPFAWFSLATEWWYKSVEKVLSYTRHCDTVFHKCTIFPKQTIMIWADDNHLAATEQCLDAVCGLPVLYPTFPDITHPLCPLLNIPLHVQIARLITALTRLLNSLQHFRRTILFHGQEKFTGLVQHSSILQLKDKQS